MRFFQEPELLSGYVSLCALLFAVFESRQRIYNVTFENVGNLYSKMLSTCQLLEGQVLSVKKLSENIAGFSPEEAKGYAQSHLRNENITSLIHEIMDLVLSCFDLNKTKEAVEAVQAIFNFTSLAITLEESVTAFYQGILAGSEYRASEIESIYHRMDEYLEKLKEDKAKTVASNRIKEVCKNKWPYFLIWILAAIATFPLIELLSGIGR